jgi:hypothetical protein
MACVVSGKTKKKPARFPCLSGCGGFVWGFERPCPACWEKLKVFRCALREALGKDPINGDKGAADARADAERLRTHEWPWDAGGGAPFEVRR